MRFLLTLFFLLPVVIVCSGCGNTVTNNNEKPLEDTLHFNEPCLSVLDKMQLLVNATSITGDHGCGMMRVDANGEMLPFFELPVQQHLYNKTGRDNIANYWTNYVFDYAVYDSLWYYRKLLFPMYVPGVTDTSYQLRAFTGDLDSVLHVYQLHQELITVEDKMNWFIFACAHTSTYILDSANKTIIINTVQKPAWFAEIDSVKKIHGDQLRPLLDYKAKFLFIYAMRNAHDRYKKIIFNYKSTDEKQQPIVHEYFETDKIFRDLFTPQTAYAVL